MIEIITEGQESSKIKLPRNLRQIGNPGGEHRIYMEDYVYSFLHTGMLQKEKKTQVAVLAGNMIQEGKTTYYFIRGAVALEKIKCEKGIPQLNNEHWSHVYKKMQEYFDHDDPDRSMKVLGWCMLLSGGSAKMNTDLERVHRIHFKESKPLMLKIDTLDKEDQLYIYEKNSLREKDGYYIFYEPNPQMQEYMVSFREIHNPDKKTEEVDDKITREWQQRVVPIEKEQEKKKGGTFTFAACAAVVVGTFLLGITSIRDANDMAELKETVAVIGDNIESNIKGMTKEEETEEVVVTTVEGEVEPIEEVSNEVESPVEATEETTEETAVQAEEAPVEAASTEADTILAQGYYIVQKGDSLEAVVKRIYGNTDKLNEIIEMNQLADKNTILTGQKLILP